MAELSCLHNLTKNVKKDQTGEKKQWNVESNKENYI